MYLSGQTTRETTGKTFRSGGALSLETINAPSNRAWKITSGRNWREGKETRGGEEWNGHDGIARAREAQSGRKELFVRSTTIPWNCEAGEVSRRVFASLFPVVGREIS